MRPDQRIRLRELSEKLIDVFLVEADPDEWPGADTAPAARTKQQRGDRAWAIKAINGLASTVRHTAAIESGEDARSSDDPNQQQRQDDALDRRIADAETRAAQRTKDVIDYARR